MTYIIPQSHSRILCLGVGQKFLISVLYYLCVSEFTVHKDPWVGTSCANNGCLCPNADKQQREFLVPPATTRGLPYVLGGRRFIFHHSSKKSLCGLGVPFCCKTCTVIEKVVSQMTFSLCYFLWNGRNVIFTSP